jgi:hypothetical protein
MRSASGFAEGIRMRSWQARVRWKAGSRRLSALAQLDRIGV